MKFVMKIEVIIVLALFLGPMPVWAQSISNTSEPAAFSQLLHTAQQRYEQSPKSVADVMVLASDLSDLGDRWKAAQGQISPEERASFPMLFGVACWNVNNELYGILNKIGKSATRSIQDGRSNFESQDWPILSGQWGKVRPPIMDSRLESKKREVERLFDLVTAINKQQIDLTKINPETRRFVADEGRVGPVGD